MNQESIFRIPGTKLPDSKECIEYRCIHWGDDIGNFLKDFEDNISFGYKEFKYEIYILGDRSDYTNENHFMYKESDLIKLAEEQGIEWRVKPEFVIPKGHQIQITADNLNDINKLRDINNELFKSHMTLDNIGNYIIHTQIGNYLLRGVYEDDYILIDNNSNKTNMEKKIIGYKLKFVEYKDAVRVISDDNEFDFDLFKREWQQYPSTKKKLERAKLLNVWFEPVYEDDYKVGDYVTVIKEAPSYEGKVNKTYLITNIDGQSLYFADMRAINTKLVEVRLATPEEIEAINNKVINIGFDVKIKNKRAFVGNDDITEFVLGLVKQYNNLDYGTHGGFGHKIKDITFSKTGCKSVDTKLSDWKKIYDEIKPSSYSNIEANAC